MHMDPALPMIVLFAFVILLLGLMARFIKQPPIIAYIIAGILLGPAFLGLITDEQMIIRLGEFGVMMLLFFIGLEVVPEKLFSSWRVSILGTLLQILLSVALIGLLGLFLDWSFSRILLLGFVISLSSTAVVLNLFKNSNELHTNTGQTVLGILLAQDLAVVLMIISLSFFSAGPLNTQTLYLQLLGAFMLVGLTYVIISKSRFEIPWSERIQEDHELQVFAALVCCFGMALISSYFHLSTALGAFIGGMIIGRAKETDWIHKSLEPFRVLFVAFFFVSLGLLVDITFIKDNLAILAFLIVIVILTNLFINAMILHNLQHNWRDSLYAGTILSPIGEFSFILAAIGLQIDAINHYGYQLIVSIIVFSLMLSPFLIFITKKSLRINLHSNTADEKTQEPPELKP